MKELGERAIVYGDFASGPRTATDKGGPPTSRMIEPGDLLLLDFSVVVDGYRGDFTNTFAVGGGPTPEQRRAVRRLRRGHEGGRGQAQGRGDRPRRRRRRPRPLPVARPARPLPPPHRPRDRPGPPRAALFRPRQRRVLVAGDVVTLEPGLYVEGVGGIRIERNYLITAEGFETLSNHEIRIDQ